MIELDKEILKKNLDYAHKWDAAIESRGDSPLSDARVFLAIAIKLIEEKLVGGYEADSEEQTDVPRLPIQEINE